VIEEEENRKIKENEKIEIESNQHTSSSSPEEKQEIKKETLATSRGWFSVGKIAEKPICRNVFLTIWHCILSAELTTHSFRLFFLAILPTGLENKFVFFFTLHFYTCRL